MAEWPIAPHLKCGIPARGSGVQIPLSPFILYRMKDLIVPEIIEKKIYLIRDQKVMLDRDLAFLYDVPTKALNQAVKRNRDRFPKDFMFLLTWKETTGLRSQIVTLKNKDHEKYRPYVFTEQGVAMLSSVLNSKRAIQVNIQIIRTFIKMRELLATHKDILKKIEEMEKRYDKQFRIVFDIIRGLSDRPEGQRKRIGFKP